MKKILPYILVFVIYLSVVVLEEMVDGYIAKSATLFDEETREEVNQLLQVREGYQLGTNCELQGDIMVHLFFVDDEESRWDKDTVAQFTRKQILPGLEFLENEAKRHGVTLDLSVESHRVGSKSGIAVSYNGTISKTKEHTLDIPDRIAFQFGCQDGWELYEKLYKQNKEQEVILLFALNKDGVPYAFKHITGDRNNPYLEFGVVFVNYLGKDFDMDENTYPASSVAHEILHTYGAIDMYTPDEVKKLLKPIYPRDIMLSGYLNVEDMEISDYTAYTVGWKAQAPTVSP